MSHDTISDLTHKFLIALPGMGDHRFKQSVIFICHHDQDGTMGLIINKPKGDLTLSDMLPQIGIEGDIQSTDNHVLMGGPVDIDRGFVLHSDDTKLSDKGTAMPHGLYLSSNRSVLESLVSGDAPNKALLLIGYAGWNGGQLEREIQDNTWITAKSDPDIIFSQNHKGKWARAVRSLGISPEQLSAVGGQA